MRKEGVWGGLRQRGSFWDLKKKSGKCGFISQLKGIGELAHVFRE